jgi:hypothetical protein
MSKLLKFVGAVAIILLAAMQFARPARIKLRVNPSETIEAVTQMPPEVSEILDRSCGDCHSEKTRWRWYSNVAPVSWLQMADVGMARQVLDFSHWAQYTPRQQSGKLRGVCREMRSGDMPLWYYKPLHPHAWLSSADVQQVCQWTETERQKLAAIAPPGQPSGAHPEHKP